MLKLCNSLTLLHAFMMVTKRGQNGLSPVQPSCITRVITFGLLYTNLAFVIRDVRKSCELYRVIAMALLPDKPQVET